MSRVARIAASTIVIGGALLAVAGPAGAGGKGQYATLTVSKVVEGTAPAGTEFTIEVDCILGLPGGEDVALGVIIEPPFTEELTFGATGGEQEVLIGDASTCTITETDDGGADSSSGPVQVIVAQPEAYSATITNTFDEVAPTSDSVVPSSSSTTTSGQVAAAATPRFTG